LLPSTHNKTRRFFLAVPLNGIHTTGGYNNFGFSVALCNVRFDGSVGFFCSTAHGQLAGIYTSSASYRNTATGGNWGLFAFGANPETQIASYTAKLEGYATPRCPADLGSAGGLYGQDGALDNNDFISFINLFFDQSPLAQSRGRRANTWSGKSRTPVSGIPHSPVRNPQLKTPAAVPVRGGERELRMP
jgi:hypothetical protein